MIKNFNKYFYFILILNCFCLIFYVKKNQNSQVCISSIFEPKLPKKISIVIPIHVKQIDQLVQQIRSWSYFRPCNSASSILDIDLIFFIARRKNQNFDHKILINQDNLECFKQVKIVEYIFFDESSDNHNIGSRIMFEYMLGRSNEVFMEQSYVFYMEADTRPIRPNWLVGLYKECINGDFWVKGSIQRGIKMKSFIDSFHINGNAIYKIDDQNFRNFYFNLVKPYFDKIHFNYGYDGGIFKFIYDLNNIDEVKHVFHKFRFSGFVYNSCHTNYSVQKMADQFQDTYFVHGGVQI